MQQVSRDNQFLEKPLLLLLSKSQLKAGNKRQPKAFDRSIQRMNREKRKEKKKKKEKNNNPKKKKKKRKTTESQTDLGWGASLTRW